MLKAQIRGPRGLSRSPIGPPLRYKCERTSFDCPYHATFRPGCRCTPPGRPHLALRVQQAAGSPQTTHLLLGCSTPPIETDTPLVQSLALDQNTLSCFVVYALHGQLSLKAACCQQWNLIKILFNRATQRMIQPHMKHMILEYFVGIQGTVLSWFKSYLTNRSFSVRLGHLSSLPAKLSWRVPQGSILAPILFFFVFTSFGLYFQNAMVYNFTAMQMIPKFIYLRNKINLLLWNLFLHVWMKWKLASQFFFWMNQRQRF